MLRKLAYILALLSVLHCAPAPLWPLTTTSTYNPDNSLYGYDANGNRTGETYSNVPPAVLNKASRSLDYDAQDRLTKQELADGNKQTWTLSAVGNWTQTQLNQDPAQTRTHTATHQIVSMAGTALSYDAKGNMTTDQRGYVYRWDHENRLIEVLGPPVVESATTQPDANSTPGSTTQPEDPYADPDEVSTPTSQPTTQPTIAWRQTYTYDAMGRRVSRTTYQNEVASTTVYVSAGMQEVAEYTDGTDAAAPSRTYVYGSYVDEPVQVRVYASATTQPASTQSATTQPSYTDYYYHTNALYSVIAVTDTAGAVVERYTYDAYGQRTITDADGAPRAESLLGNDIGFTGRRLDPLTNQYYFRARYYDAAQGRFISRDPLEYVDGMSLYGGYYVPNGLDPIGMVTKKSTGTPGQLAEVGGTAKRLLDLASNEVLKDGTLKDEQIACYRFISSNIKSQALAKSGAVTLLQMWEVAKIMAILVPTTATVDGLMTVVDFIVAAQTEDGITEAKIAEAVKDKIGDKVEDYLKEKYGPGLAAKARYAKFVAEVMEITKSQRQDAVSWEYVNERYDADGCCKSSDRDYKQLEKVSMTESLPGTTSITPIEITIRGSGMIKYDAKCYKCEVEVYDPDKGVGTQTSDRVKVKIKATRASN